MSASTTVDDVELPVATDGVAPKTLASLVVTWLLVGSVIVSFRIGGTRRPDRIEEVLIIATFAILPFVDSRTLRRLPVSLTLVSSWAWMAASFAWSTNPPSLTSWLITYLAPVVALYLLIGMCRLDTLFHVMLWVARLTIIACLTAIIVLPEARVWNDPFGRSPILTGWRGVFTHKNFMGPFLAVAAVTVMCFDSRRATRWLSFAAIAVLLGGSRSMTGVGATIAAVGVVASIRIRHGSTPAPSRRRFLVGAIGATPLLAAAGSAAFAVLGKDSTITGRTDIWRAVAGAWAGRPWVGHGVNSELGSGPPTELTEQLWRSIGFEVTHAHNGILDVGLQLGLIGVVIVVALVIGSVVDAVRLLAIDPQVAAWCLALITAQLVVSITEDALLGNIWVGGLVIVRMVELRRLQLPPGDVTESACAFRGPL